MCVQETRWNGSKDKRLNVDMDRVSVEEVHENSPVDMKRVSDSIMRGDVECFQCVCPTGWISVRRERNLEVRWMNGWSVSSRLRDL